MKIEERLKILETEIARLKTRNKIVEMNKTWETSLVRTMTIFVLTYLILGSYMWVIEVSNPWQNAVVPSVGFGLSTLSLPFVRKIWDKFQ